MATEVLVHQVLRFLVIKFKAFDKDLVVKEQGQPFPLRSGFSLSFDSEGNTRKCCNFKVW